MKLNLHDLQLIKNSKFEKTKEGHWTGTVNNRTVHVHKREVVVYKGYKAICYDITKNEYEELKDEFKTYDKRNMSDLEKTQVINDIIFGHFCEMIQEIKEIKDFDEYAFIEKLTKMIMTQEDD